MLLVGGAELGNAMNIPEREASNASTVLHLSLSLWQTAQQRNVHKEGVVLCKLDQWRHRVCEPTETAGEQLQARKGPTSTVMEAHELQTLVLVTKWLVRTVEQQIFMHATIGTAEERDLPCMCMMACRISQCSVQRGCSLVHQNTGQVFSLTVPLSLSQPHSLLCCFSKPAPS